MSMQSSYNAGASIVETTSLGPVTFANNNPNNLDVMQLTKNPSASQSGNSLTISMGTHTTGDGISVTASGSGNAINATGPVKVTGVLTLTTALSAPNGGTGQSTYTVGDMLYASSASVLSKLAAVASGQFLRSNGTAAAPSWGGLVAADIPNLDASKIASGQLATARGGTGADGSSVAANWVLASPDGSAGGVTYRALVATDIPNLDAGKTTTGTFAAAQIPGLDASKIVTGALTQARGGTGIDTSSVTDGQLLIGSTAGHTWTLGSIAGTANQIIVTPGAGAITLTTPQDIATSSKPQFAAIGVGTAAPASGIHSAGNIETDGTLALGSGGTGDVVLARDAANVLALRNGTAAQTARVYNTFTSSTSFERFQVVWAGNVCQLATSCGAFNTPRPMVLGNNNNNQDVPVPTNIVQGQNVYYGATGYVNGGDLVIAAGTGRRFFWITDGTGCVGKVFGLTINGTLFNFTDGLNFVHSDTATVEATNLGNAISASLGTSITVTISGAVVYLSATATTHSIDVTTNATGATAAWSSDGKIIIGGTAPIITTANHDLIIAPGPSAGIVANVFIGGIASGSTNLRFYDSTSVLSWAGRSVIQSPSDGVLELTNNAQSGFSMLALGGTSASCPGIKRNGAAINFRLANDSADAAITCSTLAQSGKTTTYNGVLTAGWGLSAVAAQNNITSQTNNATIITFTPTADADFYVSGQVNVVSATGVSTALTVTYTDVNGVVQTAPLPLTATTGNYISGGLITGTGTFHGSSLHIRAQANTLITVATAAGTFDTVLYSASAVLARLS